MIKPEQVPIEAVKAFIRAEDQERTAEEIIAAAINAWPGGNEKHSLILLPMPQEKNDD